MKSSAHAAKCEAAFCVGGRRVGPGRQVFAMDVPQDAIFEGIANGPHVTAVDAVHGKNHNLDAPGRLPVHVEQTPLDHLFGTKCDLASGLAGIRVEVDPGSSIAGCQCNGAELIVTRRGNASCTRGKTIPSYR